MGRKSASFSSVSTTPRNIKAGSHYGRRKMLGANNIECGRCQFVWFMGNIAKILSLVIPYELERQV
jgi:hypothetical protein